MEPPKAPTADTVRNTPHCTMSTSRAGIARERKVSATTRKMEAAVSSVMTSSSRSKPCSISSTIALAPIK